MLEYFLKRPNHPAVCYDKDVEAIQAWREGPTSTLRAMSKCGCIFMPTARKPQIVYLNGKPMRFGASGMGIRWGNLDPCPDHRKKVKEKKT